jgi:hypothetical protein
MSWFKRAQYTEQQIIDDDEFIDSESDPLTISIKFEDETKHFSLLKLIETHVYGNSPYKHLWDALIKGITDENGNTVGGYSNPNPNLRSEEHGQSAKILRLLVKQYGGKESLKNSINNLKKIIQNFVKQEAKTKPSLYAYWITLKEYLDIIKNRLYSGILR